MVEAKGRGSDFLSRRWHDHSTQSLRTPAGRAAGCGHCDGDALDHHRDDPFLQISHRVVTRRNAAKQPADDAADPKIMMTAIIFCAKGGASSRGLSPILLAASQCAMSNA